MAPAEQLETQHELRVVDRSNAKSQNCARGEILKSGGTREAYTVRIANALGIRKARGVRMSEISYADALNTFGRWESQNKKLAVLGSNSGCVISLRNARVTLCLDDMLQLTFSEDGILRLFLRGATFAPADPKDFPADSGIWSADLEAGVQIRFVNIEMQCFLFPSRGNISN